ncbi:hypothetical protein O6H91_18G002900 [Diphasiastrum complanatum]|nr:hypothetical protein O6H91_18G002900 [Diphasiastrum complanatum]
MGHRGGSSAEAAEAKHVVVCGAGVIGSCTAYFLAQKGVKVTVVEKCGVASAASGKAGGFLALDWCDGSLLKDLARASFDLHETLAEELNGRERYGYRRLDALSLVLEETTGGGVASHSPKLPAWIDGCVKRAAPIGTQKTTAQVHPFLFTQAVLSDAMDKHGVRLLMGNVGGVELEPAEGEGYRVTGVMVDGNFVGADAVVLAMGPWTGTNRLVSDLTTISGIKAHSIVLYPQNPNVISPHALFLQYKTQEGKQLDPEVYPRPSGEVYVCGMSEEVEIPVDSDRVKPRKEAIVMLRRIASTVSSELVNAELRIEQACFLPCSVDGRPLIGGIPNVAGAYVGTGHSCWGILNGPATGSSLAELIVDGVAKTVDLSPFDPARFGQTSHRQKQVAL